MSDEDFKGAQNVECQTQDTETSLSLLDLPIEIFLYICSFLDASTLVHKLSLVCKQFHNILRDDSLWKVRINQTWPNADYPVLPLVEDDELFWKLSCVSIEKQAALWRKNGAMEKISISNAHNSTIDGLLLMQGGKICISGARDRSLICWSFPADGESKYQQVTYIDFAHDGWIWDLTAIDNTVYSCSWDQSIKAWTLTNSGLVHLKTYETIVSGALLCVASCPDLSLFATGSFCKTVLVFDSRTGYKPIVRYQPHQRAIIRLAMSSQFILSASEDRTVSVWDHRAGRTMKNITISKKAFPMSMSMQRDIIYVGDSNAKLHVLDPKQEFEPVKCYTTDHTKAITGVHLAAGCLITSSMDKTVRISSPTDPPQYLTSLNCGYGEIASIDYSNEVLAVSGTEGIEIWRPQSRIRHS